jgi:large subunit GTPase 1
LFLSVARGFTRAGQGNPDEARAARYILKDYVDGRLLFCHPPPGLDGGEFNAEQQEQTLEALRLAGKKKAPTTRVGKDADTFVPSAAPAPDSAGPAQGSKSRKIDNDFFSNGTGLSSRAFVKGGQEFSRTVFYPHQRAIGSDGRPSEGVTLPAPVLPKEKKHFKGTKHVKSRSGRGYD